MGLGGFKLFYSGSCLKNIFLSKLKYNDTDKYYVFYTDTQYYHI